MKRCLYIVAAALIVLLSYPSTHSLAGSSKQTDNTTPRIITPVDGGPIALCGDDGGGDGDSDGLAGIANQKTNRHSGPDPSSVVVRVAIQVWWKFLVWQR